MFGLLLALFPTSKSLTRNRNQKSLTEYLELMVLFAACLLLWLLHQKGLFDPCYDWWEDHFDLNHHRRLLPTRENVANRHHKHHHGVKPHNHHRRTHQQRHKHHHSQDNDVVQKMLERDHSDSHYYHQLHRVHKDSKQKQRRRAKHGIVLPRDVHVERRRRQRLRES